MKNAQELTYSLLEAIDALEALVPGLERPHQSRRKSVLAQRTVPRDFLLGMAAAVEQSWELERLGARHRDEADGVHQTNEPPMRSAPRTPLQDNRSVAIARCLHEETIARSQRCEVANASTDVINDHVHLFKVPPSAITAVILGSRASAETTRAVHATLAEKSDLQHVALYQTRTSDTRFEVVLSSVSRNQQTGQPEDIAAVTSKTSAG
jgi:hypothetical protein